MHDRTEPDSPVLAPVLAPGQSDDSASRLLYVRANDPEALFAGTGAVEALRAALGPRSADSADLADLDELRRRAVAWADEETRRYRALLAKAPGDRAVPIRRAALGCAPLAAVSGGWLQWLSAPGNAEDAVVLRVLALYASDVGVGHPGESRGNAYTALLRRLRLSQYAVPSARLAADRRIGGSAFHLPGLLLAMSRRPDDFAPEILGADLCLRTAGLLPPLSALRELLPDAADWAALDPGAARRPGEPSGLELCRAAVDGMRAGSGGGRIADRTALGFGWALTELRHWSDALFAELDAALDPAYEMAELMRQRAREGSVYHQSFQLAGRPLSDWLKECRTDPGPLLRVLAESRLVKPGNSERSALVRGLVGANGPMFRVFSEEDLAVIRRWIDSLPAAPERRAVPGPAPSPSSGTPALLRHDPPVAEGDRPADLREAYHLLQTRSDTPAVRRYAESYVRGWLARSRHGADRADVPLPDRWTPQGLRPWLADQHDRHGREFEDTAGAPLPSRAALIDSTVQLAPLTLIDGSWLQGFTDYGQASSEIGFSLFETYWDELGNGETALNHPLIYREVLAEMGVELPPTGSAEFARWPGFRDRSFELPVYWLSIGRFPRTFLPEVLGLNLAMELSGVGGSYRRARLALREHGFDTRFVDIHNVIDNVATGHSAWAADAVDTYLTTLPGSPGSGAREEAWERVRTGYRSLSPSSGFLARRAARRVRRASGAR
ncbi:iron-containing redox enzyme family protein [Streptomyces sp. NPDC015184]|uniref:iron-containing redox enzyme family protein n=1 Tax=Streptomyces sp. NPDC015184 TaxID=3364946 RepID=UPI0036FC0946